MGNVRALPMTGLAPSNADVAAALRKFADWVDDGGFGAVRTAIVLVEPIDGQMMHSVCGEPIDLARIIGLIEFAKSRIMSAR